MAHSVTVQQVTGEVLDELEQTFGMIREVIQHEHGFEVVFAEPEEEPDAETCESFTVGQLLEQAARDRGLQQ